MHTVKFTFTDRAGLRCVRARGRRFNLQPSPDRQVCIVLLSFDLLLPWGLTSEGWDSPLYCNWHPWLRKKVLFFTEKLCFLKTIHPHTGLFSDAVPTGLQTSALRAFLHNTAKQDKGCRSAKMIQGLKSNQFLWKSTTAKQSPTNSAQSTAFTAAPSQ